MKLYTEKEVDKAMLLYLKGIPRMIILEQHITPIELPSDEEIERRASQFGRISSSNAALICGKWVIEQINLKINEK